MKALSKGGALLRALASAFTDVKIDQVSKLRE